MWIWSFVSAIFFLVFFIVGFFEFPKFFSAHGPSVWETLVLLFLLCVSIATFVIGVVYAVLFLAACWESVTKKSDKVSPLLRVLLGFLPIFNLVWNFFVYWKFALRANAEADNLKIEKKISSGVALSYCVVSLFPVFVFGHHGHAGIRSSLATMFVSLLSLILLVMFVIQSRDAAVSIAEEKKRLSESNSAFD